MFDEFEAAHKAHIPEPELVPILDALTSVIFFLLLSTTFIELTKLTVPPSQTNTITVPVTPPPVGAKMFVKITSPAEMELNLHWFGEKPDRIIRKVARKADNTRSKEMELAAHQLVSDFKARYPQEKTLQMSLSEQTTYQELISVMDGVRAEVQDIVLLSPEDVKSVE